MWRRSQPAAPSIGVVVRRTDSAGTVLDEAIVVDDEPAHPYVELVCNDAGSFAVIWLDQENALLRQQLIVVRRRSSVACVVSIDGQRDR